MSKLRNALALVGVLALPLSVHAYTIVINGTPYTVNSVDVNSSTSQNSLTITTSPAIDFSGGSTPPPTEPPPTEPPPTEPPPTDPSVPVECGATPEHVQIISGINWTNPGNQTRISLRGQTVAMPFTSTSNALFEGQVDIAATTGNGGVAREVWFSRCPGVGFAEAVRGCKGTGTSNTIVGWNQADGRRCQLGTNQNWYLNVRNAEWSNTSLNCAIQNCDVYRNVQHNGQP